MNVAVLLQWRRLHHQAILMNLKMFLRTHSHYLNDYNCPLAIFCRSYSFHVQSILHFSTKIILMNITHLCKTFNRSFFHIVIERIGRNHKDHMVQSRQTSITPRISAIHLVPAPHSDHVAKDSEAQHCLVRKDLCSQLEMSVPGMERKIFRVFPTPHQVPFKLSAIPSVGSFAISSFPM